MATLWERVRVLEGQTLPTAGGRATFEIAAVDDSTVHVVPHSTGNSRPINWREFRRAEACGLIASDISIAQLQEAGISEFNRSYVAAIICAISRQTPTN